MNIKRNCIFLLDKEKNKTDAKLRYRIKWETNTVAFNVGYRIDIDKWIPEAQRCKNNTTHGKKRIHSSYINSEIQRYEQTMNEVFCIFEQKGLSPNQEEFKELFNEKIGKDKKPQKSIFEYYQDFMIDQGRENQWTEATYKEHTTIKRHLLKFAPKLEFSDFTEKGLSLFVEYMQNVRINSKKTGMKNTTVRKNLDNLKWFLRWASEKGYNTEMAFMSYQPKLKTVKNKILFLTWEELISMYNFDFSGNDTLERVRDVFCFCCFTSLRYSDVAHLRRSDVFDSYIQITTIKTYENLKIELNDRSKFILNKYRDTKLPNDLALPVISNQKMNEYIKEIGRICNINTPITVIYYKGGNRIEEIRPKHELISTHCARRTFISNAIMMGIPPEIVMKWTGHEDYKAMKPYIDIADQAKKDAMKLFNK
ncbi:site-specific integrase [Bacteroides fragilis]|uniref:site-specific integrase n=1 Tax=Bacteroides fragilis TaxID=817 RepID=UPI00202EBD03|nr:site-specific integrase [Bacteroides fragilis]MCM0314310.1 phage integrase SAM-like domain-containing protein [Bacteroides fragilis]